MDPSTIIQSQLHNQLLRDDLQDASYNLMDPSTIIQSQLHNQLLRDDLQDASYNLMDTEYIVPMYIGLGSNRFFGIQVHYTLWYVWDSHHPQE